MSEHNGQTAIYFLVDPRAPDAVRYVGKAKVPRSRHLQHCAEGTTTPKGQWIESLRQAGIFPQMQIVEWVADSEADTAEKKWIARVKPQFLTNSHSVKALVVSGDSPAETLTALQSAERDQIIKILTVTNWNKQEASRRLGIGRQTLYNKIAQYHLKP